MPDNLPNRITLLRLGMAVVFFAVLSFYAAGNLGTRWILPAAFWIYLAAAISDVIDGWLARAWNQVTAFGRVFDPVVDKVLVCGAFVFLAGPGFIDPATRVSESGVAPWMVVLILFRELLVSAIRALAEAQGTAFAANWVGKLKMFVQSATVCVVLGVLAWHRETLGWLRVASIWITVLVSAWSIYAYLLRARELLFTRPGTDATNDPRRAAPPGDTRSDTTAAPVAAEASLSGAAGGPNP